MTIIDTCTICTGPLDPERVDAGLPYCSKTCRGVHRRLASAGDDHARYAAAVKARDAIREERRTPCVQS